jgi:hypothetical protein
MQIIVAVDSKNGDLIIRKNPAFLQSEQVIYVTVLFQL